MVARNLIKEQKYYSKEQLLNETPSRRDGIDASTEAKVRKTYCRLIDAAGQHLKMPQWAIATATVFCHRFYAVKSMKNNDRFLIPAACLFLAGKIDDSPRALDDVISVCWDVKYKHKPQEQQKLKTNQAFRFELRDLVLTAERCILYTRGFDLYIEHPYSPLTNMLKEHKLLPNNFPADSAGKNLLQACWNFINDSLKTTICLQYPPGLIAKAVLYLSARLLKVKLPLLKEKSFAELFDVEQAVLDDICSQLMDLYTFSNGGKSDGKGASNEDAAAAGMESFSPLQGASEQNGQAVDATKIVVKKEESCLETGVQRTGVADGPGKAMTQGENCKKRKAAGVISDMPELKAVKVEGLAC